MEYLKSLKPYRIICIEDFPGTREMLQEIFGRNERIEFKIYQCPHEYIMAGRPEADLVISDWSFGSVNLEFFLSEFDKSRLIIFTGSTYAAEVNCLAVLNKYETEELISLVEGITQFRIS
jgi:hypothetical protein